MSAFPAATPYVTTRRVICGITAHRSASSAHTPPRAVERHLVGELDEGLLQVRESAVTFEMFVIDIRNHRYRRKQFQKRSIAFIRFGDHQFTAAEPRIAAKGAQPPPITAVGS